MFMGNETQHERGLQHIEVIKKTHFHASGSLMQTLFDTAPIEWKVTLCFHARLQVVGIYAPHLGTEHCYLTRTSRWKIVRRASQRDILDSDSLGRAPGSSVINCGNPYVIPVSLKIVKAPAEWRKKPDVRTEMPVFTLQPPASPLTEKRERNGVKSDNWYFSKTHSIDVIL